MLLYKFCILLAATRSIITQPIPQVSLDVYPDNGGNVEMGTRIVIVCRVVGVTAGTQLTYSWTCPGPQGCDAKEYSRTNGNILELDTFGYTFSRFYSMFTCTVTIGGSHYTASKNFSAYSGGPSLSNRNPNFSPTFYFTLPRNSFVTDRDITARLSTSNVDAHIQCVHSSSNTSWSLDTAPLSTNSTDNVFQDIEATGISHFVIGDLAQYTNDEYHCVLDNGGIAYVGIFLNNGTLSSLSSPSNLQTSSITATGMVVSWDSVSGASGYYVGYDRQQFGIGTSTPSLFERVTGGTTVTLSGLSPGSQYKVTVWSTNGAGVSEGNATISSTTLEQAPSEPRSIMMTSSASTSISFNWIPPKFPNGLIHYIIEYSTSSMFTSPSSVNTSTSSNHYTLDTTVLEFGGETNYFRVVAVNLAGRNESGTTVSACYDTRPDPPSGLNGNTTVPSSVSLSWNVPNDRVCDGSGVSNYTVMYRKKSDSGGVYTNTSSSMNSITLTGLESSTLYEVQVVAFNKIGASSTSNSVDVTSGSGPPDAPKNLMITSTTSTSIAIMWNPPANNGGSAVTSYSVMVSGGTTSTTTTTMTSTTISGLTPNTMYTISVSAVNSAGSGSSAEVTETTLLSAPFDIEVSAHSRNATITWNGAGDYFTITYRIEGQSTEESVNATTNSIVLLDLTPLTSYVIQISGSTREGRIGERRTEVFTTDGAAPLPLVVFHVVIESATSITVSWDPPPNSYVSYYSITITGGGQIYTMNTTSTSVQWSQLQTNVYYNVSISAVNPRGASTVTVQVTSLLEGSSPDSTAQTANSPGVTIGVAVGCIAATLVITLGIEGLIFILCKKRKSNKTYSPERKDTSVVYEAPRDYEEFIKVQDNPSYEKVYL